MRTSKTPRLPLGMSLQVAAIIAVALVAASCSANASNQPPISATTVEVSVPARPQPVDGEQVAALSACTERVEPDEAVSAAGFSTPPRGLVFAGVNEVDRDGLTSSATWTKPEPKGGIVADSPEFKAFIKDFEKVTVWSATSESGLPPGRAPWWADEYGFPIEAQLAKDVGPPNATAKVLFDEHPDVPWEDIEQWMLIRWVADGTWYQLFSRGLTLEEAAELSTRVERDAVVGTTSNRFEPPDAIVNDLERFVGSEPDEAAAQIEAAGYCVEGIEADTGGRASETGYVIGYRFVGPINVVILVEDQ